MGFFGIVLGIVKSSRGEEEEKSEAENEDSPRIGERTGIIPILVQWTRFWDGVAEEVAPLFKEIEEKQVMRWAQIAYIFLFGLYGFGLAVVSVEKTIIINNIDLSSSKIYSAGQLSPLLVGIFTAVPALWKSIWQLVREPKRFHVERTTVIVKAIYNQWKLIEQRQRE